MKQPYYLRCTSKKDYQGKLKRYFIYTLNKETGLPPEILKNHHGKSVPIQALSSRTKRAAEAWIIQLITELKTTEKINTGGSSFGEYTQDLMVRGKCPHERFVVSEGRHLSDTYMKDRRGIYLNHIATDDILMDLILSETRRKDLLSYRERLVKRIGNTATAKKAFQLVKTVYKEAFFLEKISFDPTSGVGDIRYRPERKGIFSIDELVSLFLSDGLGPWKDIFDHTAFFLAYCAGLRKGEVLGLIGVMWTLKTVYYE